jgi:hypothetical protein
VSRHDPYRRCDKSSGRIHRVRVLEVISSSNCQPYHCSLWFPRWGAKIKIVFVDINWIQRKTEVAYVNERREGDNWDKDASRVFQVRMKVTDERVEVEMDDILTCQPD